MNTVLYIKANIKPEGASRTFRVSDCFIEAYKKNHPEDTVIELDLYKEDIDFLQPDTLKQMSGPKNEESKKNPALKYAYQFAQADKYVIAAPFWNLSFPAILKAYIDYISVSGITFKYTSEGSIGLLKNKKAVHIVSRGGNYENSPSEMGDRYLRALLHFFGVDDVRTIAINNLDVASGAYVEENVAKGMEEATLLAKEF